MFRESDFDPVKMRELYDQGKNDSQIADSLGLTPSRVRRWRQSEQLPGNRRAQFNTTEAEQLIASGWSDRRLAEHFGVSTHAIVNWRKRAGILPQADVQRKKAKKQFSALEAKALYDSGESDSAIASALHVSPSTIAVWRRQENLAPHHRLNLDDNEVMDLYRSGMSDAQIGNAVGCSAQSILRFRHAHSLPSNHRCPSSLPKYKQRPNRTKKYEQNPSGTLSAQDSTDYERINEFDACPATICSSRTSVSREENRDLRLAADEQMAVLYKGGYTDPEIANALHCTVSSVRAWRRRQGLPGQNASSKNWDRERAFDLWIAGLNDREIASQVGVSYSTIAAWRRKAGLAPVPKTGW